MVSGPYQSNLLRFFVGQYQRGLNRHRKAVRQTRSTIALGSELGAAVAVFPVYAAVRAARSVGQNIKQSVQRLRLPSAKKNAARLLDLTDFDPSVSDQVLWNLELLNQAAGECADVAKEQLIADNLLAESVMARTLVAVGNSLLPEQVRSLENEATLFRSAFLFSRRMVRGVVARLAQAAEGVAKSGSTELASLKDRQITGAASDLESRSLVLILGHTAVWDGLTQDQQSQLQQQIAHFMHLIKGIGELKERPIDSPSMSTTSASIISTTGSRLRSLRSYSTQAATRVKNKLVQPIHSFWVAVLWLIDELSRRSHSYRRAFAATSKKLPGSHPRVMLLALTRIFLPEAQSAPSLKSAVTMVHTSSDHSFESTSHDRFKHTYWEADVISIDYVEHPLERFLKWVDRIFLWIERRWQSFIDWCDRLM